MKELLQISNDSASTAIKIGDDSNPLSHEYQAKQIDRIVEAIALTLPPGVSQAPGGLAGTLSTANLDSNNTAGQVNATQQYRYDLVKDLAADLGVDHKVLQKQLQTVFTFNA